MLIKFDASDSLVEDIKQLTGEAVGSKAFHQAAILALSYRRQISDLKLRVSAAEMRSKKLDQVMQQSRDAATLFLEHIGQSDLFLDSDSADLEHFSH